MKAGFEDDFPAYCDPAGGERIQELTGGIKTNNAVDSGIDYINSLIEEKRSLYHQIVLEFSLR